MERCDEVSCDDTGHRPVGSGGLIRVYESNTRILDWNTGERSPGDLGGGLLKKGWKERVMKRVLLGLEQRPHVWGGALIIVI